MTHKVIKNFRDKTRKNKLYEARNKNGESDVFESKDSERIAFLVAEGFIEEATAEPKGEVSEPQHVGGGYYELPNGEKIKGKEEAIATLKDLETRGE